MIYPANVCEEYRHITLLLVRRPYLDLVADPAIWETNEAKLRRNKVIGQEVSIRGYLSIRLLGNLDTVFG